MKLSKNSDSGILPEWAAGIGPDTDAKQAAVVKPQMGEADMVAAKERIEQCAKESRPFHVHADLDPAKKRELAEYAEAVGLEHNAMTEVSESKRATCEALGKMAQPEAKAEPTPAPKPIVEFDLAPKEATDSKHFQKDGKWQQKQPAQRLQNRPTMAGIVPVRGGEQYEANPVKGARPGENSIGSPDAIGKVIASADKDHGQVIREQNEQRRAETSFSKDSWEAQALASMEGRAIAAGATPGIRRVESPEAQRHGKNPAWCESIKPDGTQMPDKTAGEKLALAAEQRRNDIQRAKPQDDWNKVKPLVRAAIGDELIEALKKHLPQAKAKE